MSTKSNVETKTTLKVPSLYKVVLLNNDVTPINFVIDIIVDLFGKSRRDAESLALEIHNKGRGVCGTYTREIAKDKVRMVELLAHRSGYPLKAIVE